MNDAITYYTEIAERLTYRQLQQLCKQGRSMGYINKGFSLKQKRSILVAMAAAIYLRLEQASQY